MQIDFFIIVIKNIIKMQNNNCECPCRNYYRNILRAFTPNELNTEEIILISLESAIEELKGIELYEYNNRGRGRYPTFAHCLRIHLAHPASISQALETCRCCHRHQQNRTLVNWYIYNDNLQESLPNFDIDNWNINVDNWTDSDTDFDTDFDTDYGIDSP
jgi:hypothetical protein